MTSQYVDLEILRWVPPHPLWVYPILQYITACGKMLLHYITTCDKISRGLPLSYFIITLHHHMWQDLPGTSLFVFHYYITSPHVTRSPGNFPLCISLSHYITTCDKISQGLPPSYFIIALHHHMWQDLPGTSPFIYVSWKWCSSGGLGTGLVLCKQYSLKLQA